MVIRGLREGLRGLIEGGKMAKRAMVSVLSLIVLSGFVVNGFGLSVFNIGAFGRRVDPLAVPIGTTPRRNLVLGAKYVPQFCIIQDDQYRRLVYDLNGFYPYLRVPLFFNLDFVVGLDQYIDQDFDIFSYSKEEVEFVRNVHGRGGINTLDLGGELSYRFLILGVSRPIVFGSSEEEWEFQVGENVTRDTVRYEYSGGGWQFQAGVLLRSFGVIGWGGWYELKCDTTISSPVNLGLKINYRFSDKLNLDLTFGYEEWADYSNQLTVGGELHQGPWSFNLTYLPWYYGVDEFKLGSSYLIRFKKVGRIVPGLDFSLRKDLGVVEYSIMPRIEFQINEIIGKRKRWY